MTTLQKGTLWVAGCLVFVFAASIGLSWYNFGHLDWKVVGLMAGMLLPVLGVAAVTVAWAGAKDDPAPVNPGKPADLQRVDAGKGN